MTPSATESLIQRIAFIRSTHYGAFWDFTSTINPTDTAYTTLALPVHTDTTYFTDPCGLQMFHLLSHEEGSGGESTLVDGFAAAEYLHQLKGGKEMYKALTSTRIVSHASGNKSVGPISNDTLHSAGFPVFQHQHHDSSTPSPDTLSQVRWNNDDRSVSTQWQSREEMELWYAATRKWTEILRMREFEIVTQLRPGMPVIFDNWRMLHGRKAFTGSRRVCGGYVGMDDFVAKWRMLNSRHV